MKRAINHKGKKFLVDEMFEYFGGAIGMAKKLNVTRQAVYLWKDKIPELRLYQIEEITRGKFRADSIRRSLKKKVENNNDIS